MEQQQDLRSEALIQAFPGMLRRRGQAVWLMSEKLYIPCPRSVKCQFMRYARDLRMTQAECGLLIVETVLAVEVVGRFIQGRAKRWQNS